MRLRLGILLALLLVCPVRAQEWISFDPPDHSFRLDLPLPPTVLSPKPGMLWSCAEKGQFAVVFGWAPFPDLQADQSAAALKVYTDNYLQTGGFAEKSRKPVKVDGQPGFDVEGSKDQVPVRNLLFLSPAEKRGYAVVVFGKADADHIFNSFKFQKGGAVAPDK